MGDDVAAVIAAAGPASGDRGLSAGGRVTRLYAHAWDRQHRRHQLRQRAHGGRSGNVRADARTIPTCSREPRGEYRRHAPGLRCFAQQPAKTISRSCWFNMVVPRVRAYQASW
jgi:hypothetical protein